MSVGFQVHIGRELAVSETYNGSSPCTRSEGKALLERLYTNTCNTYQSLKTRQDFRNAIDGAKRAIDNAVGGAGASSTRGFYNKEIATNLGYVRVDIEIYRGEGHFRS